MSAISPITATARQAIGYQRGRRERLCIVIGFSGPIPAIAASCLERRSAARGLRLRRFRQMAQGT